jgi:outer membrane protein OmpA-like peptidoglycan-associated protein
MFDVQACAMFRRVRVQVIFGCEIRRDRMRGWGVVAVMAAVGMNGCASTGREQALVRAPQSCADQTVHVYFDAWSADLTQEGRMVIDAAAKSVHACQVNAVEVLGLADAVGAAEPNLELSRKRADAVSQALSAAGLPAAKFEIAAAGQTGAVTADGEAKPLRRRVDVTLKVASR